MSFLTSGRRFVVIGLLAFTFLLASTGMVSLADPEKLGRVKVTFPNLPSNAPAGQELSAALQEELESTIPELAGIVVLCANACEPPEEPQSSQSSSSRTPSANFVKSRTRTTYSCKGGKCVCVGARNCVQMVAKQEQCRKRTVKCTGAGCTCNIKTPKRVR